MRVFYPSYVLPYMQVVWLTTTSVGCGSELCAGAVLFSCNYWPPGNYLGEFQQNVLPG